MSGNGRLIGRGEGGPQRSGRWIPWVFVGMFGVVLLANGLMIAFAFDSFTGLSTDQPYRKGLMHDARLAEVARQEKLGWQVGLGFRSTGERRGVLRLRAVDRDGHPILGASVTAEIVRPVTRGLDFTVDLPGRGKGRYEAEVGFPKPGLWELRYTVRGNGETVEAVRRITVK